ISARRSTHWSSKWSSRRSSSWTLRTASAAERRLSMNLRGMRSRDDPEINFIPLIDVLLVILIFLMVTTTYQRVAELQITLPEADADQMKQRPREINIGVDAQGRYVIDKAVFPFTTVAALSEALSRAAAGAKDPVVIINADANATHQSVIHVMEAARQAGLIR